MTTRWVLCRSFPLVVLCFAGFGCGGSNDAPASVTGTVTYDGKAAKGVLVKLTAADGTTYSGTTQPDGSFTITPVKDGEMTVTFETAPDPNDYMAEEFKKHKREGASGPQPAMPKKGPAGTALPPKYKDPTTSGQTWAVDKNNRTKNFDLAK